MGIQSFANISIIVKATKKLTLIKIKAYFITFKMNIK